LVFRRAFYAWIFALLIRFGQVKKLNLFITVYAPSISRIFPVERVMPSPTEARLNA
jgi:hypothetical protein